MLIAAYAAITIYVLQCWSHNSFFEYLEFRILFLEQEAHGPNRSPEKTFQIKNIFDYIIMLIKRRKKIIIIFMRIYWFFNWRNLNPLHPRMFFAKFGWNWPGGSWKEVENRKRRTDRQTTDERWSEKLTWAFSSGELKRQLTRQLIVINIFVQT